MKTRLLITILLLSLSGCASTEPNPWADYDPYSGGIHDAINKAYPPPGEEDSTQL